MAIALTKPAQSEVFMAFEENGSSKSIVNGGVSQQDLRTIYTTLERLESTVSDIRQDLKELQVQRDSQIERNGMMQDKMRGFEDNFKETGRDYSDLRLRVSMIELDHKALKDDLEKTRKTSIQDRMMLIALATGAGGGAGYLLEFIK